MERNKEIKDFLKNNHFYLYQLAMAAGISEPTIVRWFRTPLTDEHYDKLKATAESMKVGAQNE